jgi:hypothetical protein
LISGGSRPLGQIKFALKVSADAATTTPEPVGEDAHRYEMAFISYASEDRRRVLARLQSFDVSGPSYFTDILHLKPGERWKRELYRRIDEADLFVFSDQPQRSARHGYDARPTTHFRGAGGSPMAIPRSGP